MLTNNGAYRPHILIVGGAYGGFSVTANLLNLSSGGPQLPLPVSVPELELPVETKPRITILDERDGIYHTMGSPLALTSPTFACEAWRTFDDISLLGKGDVQTIQGKATSVGMTSRIVTYQRPDGLMKEIPYDYLVVATGMKRSWPIVPRALEKESYIDDVNEHVRSIGDSKRVVVVGGGAVGVEFAAEIKTSFPHVEVFLVHSRKNLLSAEPLPETFKTKTAALLKEIGVNVLLGGRVVSEVVDSEDKTQFKTKIALSNGIELRTDKVVYTNSPHSACTSFLPPRALDEHGYIKVRPTLQFSSACPNADFHFAVGDAIAWSGIKRVGNAFIMGQFAATNIMQTIAGRGGDCAECPSMKPMMALSIGDTALVYGRGGDVWSEESQGLVVGRGMGIDVCSNYLGLEPYSAVPDMPESQHVAVH